MKDTKTVSLIIEKIKNLRKSLVLSHENPDGDTLGSMLALGSLLKQHGHIVDHVISDPVPEIYKFLPFSNLVKTSQDKNLLGSYELAFSLDCGSVRRLGKAKDLWFNSKATINIDHHVSNERFANINWIESDATSTGQLVYWLAKSLNVKITKEIATLLYTTLLTDTGCFSNSNTSSNALNWGAELIELGAEHTGVYKKAFLEKPYKSIKIFGNALSNLNLTEDGKIAWTYVSNDLLKSFSATSEDTEDIVDYMIRTKGVLVSVFFREDVGETKVSLRSNTDVDVSKIAISMGGGGHKKAAGVNIKSPFLKVKDLVLKKVIDAINE
ncbi:MAG: DHH family phosphoesterase [Candidatus Melainabacteria bacterium]|nr:DHH family phosphoesterase [Candidatus Melainabacteria bacterium]